MTIEQTGPAQPLTLEQKRAAKLAELDKATEKHLLAYRAACGANGERSDFAFLFENFGIGAGDAYTNDDLDAMIAEDERKAQEKQRAVE